MEQEIAAGGPFAKMVQKVTPDVAAIFNGHTHKQYAWDAPVPDAAGQPTGKTRPIVQTGNYGEFIGQIQLTIDTRTMSVTGYKAGNVQRTTSAAQPAADLVAQYPRVAAVKAIVDKALADAAVVGNQPVGKVTADITTAFAGSPAVRDDRAQRVHPRQPGGGLPGGCAEGAGTSAPPKSASSTRAACATSCTTRPTAPSRTPRPTRCCRS